MENLMSQRLYLVDILDADKNSFNLVRLCAAFAVVISHAFSMRNGLVASEPLAFWTPFTLGGHAVNAFFVISGLTLSFSIERSPDLVHYAWSRILRIFPPLFAFGFVFAFIAGPFLTNLHWSDYFGDLHTWMYPFAVLVQFSRAVTPHEIFANAAFPEAANSPLWTIKYEIFAYICLAAFHALGLLGRASVLIMATGVTLAILTASAPPLGEMEAPWFFQLSRYGFCFLLGMIAYRLRHQISLNPWLLIFTGALAIASTQTILRQAAAIVLVAHIVMLLGARNYGLFTRLSRKSDLSYGVYIYGWPIQQTLVMLLPGMSNSVFLLLSFAIIPLFAIASWNLIEKPVLRLKHVKPRNLPQHLLTRAWATVSVRGREYTETPSFHLIA